MDVPAHASPRGMGVTAEVACGAAIRIPARPARRSASAGRPASPIPA